MHREIDIAGSHRLPYDEILAGQFRGVYLKAYKDLSAHGLPLGAFGHKSDLFLIKGYAALSLRTDDL